MSPPRLQARAATPADDAALRQLLRQTPLPGSVSLTMEREPSFFDGAAEVLRQDVAYVTQADVLVACGTRFLKRAWWHGAEAEVAYLSDLRVYPGFQRRGGWALRAGYKHLEAAGQAHPAAVTWTVIFEDNQAARRVLVGRDAGLPEYVDRGRLLCPVLLAPRRAKAPRMPPGRSLHASASDMNWEELSDFLNTRHQQRPLAAVHSPACLAGGMRWPGLQPQHWILVRERGRLAGCAAVWDLRAVRQVRVHAYHGWLRRARGPLSLLARLLGRHALPPPGAVLPMAYVSFLAAAGDDPRTARLLLRAAQAQAAQRGLHFLCACLHEDDPLAPALRWLPAVPAHGRLYEVVSEGRPAAWPAGVPHIESAAL